MKVYDFDRTIYGGDSTIDFYKFAIKRDKTLLRFLPRQFAGAVKYVLGRISKSEFKSYFFCFLSGITNINKVVEEFWKINIVRINNWYLEQKEEDDVIISASPDFLLNPVCDILGVKHLIASDVDGKTGTLKQKNCYGKEKVKRFEKEFGDCEITEFYSDSLSDQYMADKAKKAFLVYRGKITDWPENSTKKGLGYYFINREFLCFLCIGILNVLNGVLFSTLFSNFLNANLGFVAGYMTSLTISYILNSKVNFKRALGVSSYIKFCISYIPNFVIQNVIVIIIYNIMEFPRLIAYIVAAVIGTPITFLMIKVFVFRSRGTKGK